MAIPVWHLSMVSRSNGGSAVERAAYVFGTTFTSNYDNKTYVHSEKRTEVIYTNIFAPQNSPAWVYDPLQLTNSIEQAENRKDAQLVRSIYFALPIELTQEQHMALLEEYALSFVQKGMITVVSIHDDGHGNPNAHVLLTMRPLLPDGTWAPKATLEYVLDEQGKKIKLPSGHYKTKKHNTTNWNNRNNVEIWRREWADLVNSHLELAGSKERIDPRSYERQRINKVPTSRLDQEEIELEKKGIPTPRGEMNRQIRAEKQGREERERKAQTLKANMQQRKKRKVRWKLSPQQKILQEFWSEVREKESQTTVVLAPVWQHFKQEAKNFFHDAPLVRLSHHERQAQDWHRSFTREA